MENFDFEKLAHEINPDKTRLSYAENKQYFVKVAFDVYKYTGSPVESYWTLEKDDDGTEYLVANYENTVELQAESNWEALSDKKAENISLLYKGVPIKRFASAEYKFDDSDVHIFKEALVNKLATDPEFVKSMMKAISKEQREALCQAFPELDIKSEEQV